MAKDNPARSFRLTATARKLIDDLSAELGLSQTGVVESAIRELAKTQNIAANPPKEGKHGP